MEIKTINVQLDIGGQVFDSSNFQSIDVFVVFLKASGIRVDELSGKDLDNYNLMLEIIKANMSVNLKNLKMTWSDLRDYLSQWFPEYKQQDETQQQQVGISPSYLKTLVDYQLKQQSKPKKAKKNKENNNV